MNNLWIIFIFIYAFLKGSRECMKKAALKKSSSNEILFFYTLTGLIFVLPFSSSAFDIAPIFILYTFIKALIICVSWSMALFALKKMPVSLYGIMDLSRMAFSTMLGVIVLGESLTPNKIWGIVLVTLGLVLVNLKKDSSAKGITAAVLFCALANCFLNSVSGIMDKVLMRDMTSTQLQFWFMLFLSIMYGIILVAKKEKISPKCLKTNYWIPLMSLSLIIGDKILFIANANPSSEVTVMTVIKQSSVIVTTVLGFVCFKEKNILYKSFCVLVVLSGVVIALI